MASAKEFAQINWTIENPNEDSFLFKSVATLYDYKKRSCPVCDRLFATKLNRNKHMTRFHRQDLGQDQENDDAADRTCPQCDQIFSSQRNLERHVERMHNQNRASVASDSTRVNNHQDDNDLDNQRKIQALTNEINELKAIINDLRNERNAERTPSINQSTRRFSSSAKQIFSANALDESGYDTSTSA